MRGTGVWEVIVRYGHRDKDIFGMVFIQDSKIILQPFNSPLLGCQNDDLYCAKLEGSRMLVHDNCLRNQ